MNELKYCVVSDWKHSEGVDEDVAVVFHTKEEVKQELSGMEGAMNIRVYELKPTFECI
jgi:hypothetical protein